MSEERARFGYRRRSFEALRPNERPDRIVGDLLLSRASLRDDFFAIDRVENRAAHFRPRQDGVTEIEHQRYVVG